MTPDTTTIEPVLTAEQVAEVLAVSPQTVRRWRLRGVIPAIKVAGTDTFRFRPADIEAVLIPMRGTRLAG